MPAVAPPPMNPIYEHNHMRPHPLSPAPAPAQRAAENDMDTLLSPSETLAFQSFLSSMDYQDLSSPEWAMYASNGTIIQNDELFPSSQNSEALTKATKDLMALDSTLWDQSTQQHHNYDHHNHQQQQIYHSRQTYRHETFPFLTNKHLQQPMLSLGSLPELQNVRISPSSTSSSATTPATPHSPFDFSDLMHSSSHSQLPPSQLSQPILGQHPPSPGSSTKRSSTSSAPNGKRVRPSPSISSGLSTSGSSKQTLLSPSQKKANHIQSEQKRRANIRRGYEALCETVPTLREAIREEEEAEAKISAQSGSKGSRSKRKKRETGDGEKDKDKIDGRAGPRSENVVLSKTIEYINDLLADRSALLTRLHRARSALPPGHPVLTPTCTGEPLWERVWKGGDGKAEGEGNDDEEENDDCDST